MSAGVTLEGFDDLIRQLTTAPEHIRAEGQVIVRAATIACRDEVIRNYPEESQDSLRVARGVKTGILRARVRATFPSSTVLFGVVQSTAPHANLYEFGTKQRFTKGTHANRGVMPAHKTLPVIAQRHRAQMFERLKGMLTAMGFSITGSE